MQVKEQRDISADLGQLDSGRTIPMYSYERAAWMLWQAVYDGLLSNGHTHKSAVEWLQSKNARWALDGELGQKIASIGFEFGRIR